MDTHVVDALDYEHLMVCKDPGCWYCNDEPEPRSEVQRFIEAMARGDGLQIQLAA